MTEAKMFKIGVQTSGVVDEKNVEAGYKTISEAGFDCVDYNIEVNISSKLIESGEFSPYFNRSIDEIIESNRIHKEAAAKYGITFSQMHAPFPLYYFGKDEINEKCIEIVEKCLAVAAYLNCPYLVVHPITAYINFGMEEERRLNLEFYRRLIPMAKKYKVVICLENMFLMITRHSVEGSCSDFSDAVNYIDTLNAEAGEELFGFCFDTGHANLLSKSMPLSLAKLGKRLKAVHIHENNGVQDLHAMPYTYSCFFSNSPETLTDWEGFLRGLREIGYKGTLCFETFGSLKMFPKETHPQVLALIAAIGRSFAERMEETE